jgi:hypothetical protein
MDVRRVVVGVQPDGTSGVLSDQIAPKTYDYQAIPGLSDTLVWVVSPAAEGVHHRDLTTTTAHGVPGADESFVRVVRIPPDSVFASPDFDAEAAEAESLAVMPPSGGVEHGEGGMHRTPTFDLITVLSGRLRLVLSNGEDVVVDQGDIVVQLAGMHRWSNETDEPAVLSMVHVRPPSSPGPGTVESGTTESHTAESGTVESHTVESGAVESGAVESGTVESRTVESGTVEHHTPEPSRVVVG